MNFTENDRKLIRLFLSKQNSSKVINALKAHIIRHGALPSLEQYNYISNAEFEDKFRVLSQHKAYYLTILSSDYPCSLRQIYDPPLYLITKGNKMILSKPKIAIIGGRSASYSYLNFVKEVARFLAERGFVIVSGLANGIDTYAHIGAGTSNTIAVIASGMDICYPRQNSRLFAEIQEQGLVITESEFGVPPKASLFPRRNRIIVGLASKVIASNVKLKSGSLITCRLAIENNRDLIVVPGAPLDIQHEGSNSLIRDGAMIFTNFDDLGNYLQENFIEYQAVGTELSNNDCKVPVSDELMEIINLIPFEGIYINELLELSNKPYNKILSLIAELELENIIHVDSTKKLFKVGGGANR